MPGQQTWLEEELPGQEEALRTRAEPPPLGLPGPVALELPPPLVGSQPHQLHHPPQGTLHSTPPHSQKQFRCRSRSPRAPPPRWLQQGFPPSVSCSRRRRRRRRRSNRPPQRKPPAAPTSSAIPGGSLPSLQPGQELPAPNPGGLVGSLRMPRQQPPPPPAKACANKAS